MIDLQTQSDRATRRSGGVWDYISPSRLNLWLRCPHAFKLRYIDGIRTPTTPSLFLGRTVHHGLEVFYRHRQLGIATSAGDAVGRMLESWDEVAAEEEVQFKDDAERTKLRARAADLVRAYVDHVPDDEPQPLAVETTLECPLVDPATGEDLGVPLLGIVDVILGDQAGPLIADFKTAANSAVPLEITHEIQLSCYAYLLRQATGRKESALEIRSLIKTKVPRITFHRYAPREDHHFQRLFAVIRAYLDDLDRRRFIHRPTWGCAMCDFRDAHCL